MAIKSVTLRCEFDGKTLQHDRAGMAKFKAGLKPGQQIAMTLEEWGKARTRLQQGLLHELLGRYARTNGQSLVKVKILFKIELGYWLPADKVMSGAIEPPKWRSAVVDLAKYMPEFYQERTLIFLQSEADYTTRQEKAFIDYTILQCQESGVAIDDILQQIAEVHQ